MDDYTDLGRLQQFFRHWESTPPVHVSLACFLGYKPAPLGASSPASASAPAKDDTGSILDMLTGDPDG